MSIQQVQVTRLPFEVPQAVDMFQRNINEIFKGLPNIFGLTDYILVVGFGIDGKDSYGYISHTIHASTSPLSLVKIV